MINALGRRDPRGALASMLMAIPADVRNEIGQRAIRNLANPTLTWHGVEDPELQGRRLLRIGDCSWQVIDRGHTFGRPGYPAMVADRLRSMGVAMAFDDCYAGTSSQISIEMLERVAPERPDAIIVQMGVLHGLLELLALWDAGLVTVRAAANRRLGVLGGPLHRRLTAPLLRRYGRPCMAPVSAEQVASELDALFAWIDARHPGVPRAVLPPHGLIQSGWADPVTVQEATDCYLDSAVRHGADILDYRERLRERAAGRERRFYGANGYDLRAPGHEVIADMLLTWLSAQWGLDRPRPDSPSLNESAEAVQ